MKNSTVLFSLILAFSVVSIFAYQSCSQTDAINIHTLNVEEFSSKLQSGNVQILDVRTAEEYQSAHIHGAKNFDISGNDFANQISTLDKKTPVFVYCRSGSRSRSAASILAKAGFTSVNNLEGGLTSWLADKKPYETGVAQSSTRTTQTGDVSTLENLTKEQFNTLLVGDKLVLVDVYATWCGPCKKLAPILKTIADEKAPVLKLLKIDADKNTSLTQELSVQALPTLLLYKNGELVWREVGLQSKEVILQKISSFQ